MAEYREELGVASTQERRPQPEVNASANPLKSTYRGWIIDYDPPPIPIRTCDWQFWHQDYDGPEDGRCGHAGSLAEAQSEIDMREDD